MGRLIREPYVTLPTGEVWLKRTFERPSLGQMLIPCTKEAGCCDDSLHWGWVHWGCGSPVIRGRDSGPRQAKAIHNQHTALQKFSIECNQLYPLSVSTFPGGQALCKAAGRAHARRSLFSGRQSSATAASSVALPTTQVRHLSPANGPVHILVHRAKVRNDWEMSPELDEQTEVVSELELWTVSHTQLPVPRGFR